MPSLNTNNSLTESGGVPAPTPQRRGKYTFTPVTRKNRVISKTQTSEMVEKIDEVKDCPFNNTMEKINEWRGELPPEPSSTDSPRVSSSVVPSPARRRQFKLVKTKKEVTIQEYVPRARALWLYKHLQKNPDLLARTSAEHTEKMKGMGTFFSDKEAYASSVLNFLRRCLLSPTDNHTVVYHPNVTHGYGRLFSSRRDSVSIQGLARVFRHTLLAGELIDIDAKNCYPEIICQYAESKGIKFSVLREYVNNRQSILNMASSREKAKTSFLKVIFGGAADMGHGLTVDTMLKSLKKEVKELYPKIYALDANEINILSGVQKIKKEGKDWKNLEGGTVSLLCQCIENALLKEWISVFPEGSIMALCFDGFMVKSGRFSEEELNALFAKAEEKGFAKTGIRLSLITKEMDEGLPIPEDELEDCEQQIDDGSFREELGFENVDGETGKEVSGFLNDYNAKAQTLIVSDLTKLNMGQLFEFENDVEAGRILGYHFLKDGYLHPVRVSNNEPITLYVHNPSISNRISPSKNVLLNMLEGLKILMKKGKGFSPPNHGQWKSIAEVITTYAENENASDDIIMKLNYSTMGKSFYRNGYYDLAKKRFVSREEDPTAVTMVRIERDFYSEEEWGELSKDHPSVKEVYKNIVEPFGVDEQERFGRLRIIARAQGGHFEDKMGRHCIDQGDRDAGKGTYQNMKKNAFGEFPNGYVTTGSAPTVQGKGVSDPALVNKEMISCGAYLARHKITNETLNSTGSEGIVMLDGEMMKSDEGVDRKMGRLLFGQDMFVIPIAFTSMAMNSVPPVRGDANCLDNTAFFNLPYQFVDSETIKKCKGIPCLRETDPTIKQKCRNPEWIKAFTWLVYDAWRPEPFNPRGPEVSARNKELRKSYFHGSLSNKGEGCFTSEHSLFSTVFERPSPDDLKTYNPKEWFVPAYQISEVWARGFEEQDSKANIKLIVESIKKSRPPEKGCEDMSNNKKVGAYLGKLGELVKKDCQRIKIDGKSRVLRGFSGIRWADLPDPDDNLEEPDEEDAFPPTQN